MTSFPSEETSALFIEGWKHKPKQLRVVRSRVPLRTTHIVLKCGDTFLMTDECGDLLASQPEMGLFRRGTRFLHACNLSLEGQALINPSHQSVVTGNDCHIALANAFFVTKRRTIVETGTIHITRRLELEQDHLVQTITMINSAVTTLPVTLSLELHTDFETREWHPHHSVPGVAMYGSGEKVALKYYGSDNIERIMRVQFEPAADRIQPHRIDWIYNLRPAASVQVRINVEMSELDVQPHVMGSKVTLWKKREQQQDILARYPFFREIPCSQSDKRAA